MLTVDKRKAQVRNELNLQADYGNGIGCNIREAEGNLCNLGFILRGSSHSLLFELPDDYSKIQCENAWASVVYYTYCAGVIGKLPQYANGRKLLEAIEGRLKSESKPHETRINDALVSNAGDPLFGGPDGYVPYEAAKVVEQPSFFGAEEAYADPTEPTWQDDHKREKLD
jgi:hypothetical protein